MNESSTVVLINDNVNDIASLSSIVKQHDCDLTIYSKGILFIDSIKTIDFKRPSCLIMDVIMPDMTGIELQETLNQQKIFIPTIFITAYSEVSTAVRAMKNGAIDYFTKPLDDGVLLAAIEKALARDFIQKQREQEKENFKELIEQLTVREYETMKLMVEGVASKDIAKQLDISVSTVEQHRAKVMKKLKIHTLAELIHLAFLNNECPDFYAKWHENLHSE